MVQQGSGAAMGGVPRELSREECVGLMAQTRWWEENNAALRDVSSMPKREEFVKSMAQRGGT